MRRLLTSTLLLIALLLQPLCASAAQRLTADTRVPQLYNDTWRVEQDLQVAQSGGKSLNQAIAQVKRQYPNSRVLNAETKRSGNREEHRIKILTQDGRVRTITVRGRSLGSGGR